jgi:hypothetical protein
MWGFAQYQAVVRRKARGFGIVRLGILLAAGSSAPSPEVDAILLESGEMLLTEAGNPLLLESAA